ncbi:MAG: DNA-binding protein [Bacteriovorax sp.]|nr:DNA-binding protein [Bacteriovorax sp.]
MRILNIIFIIICFSSVTYGQNLSGITDKVKFHVLRLKPGEDLRLALENYAKDKKIKAGSIVTCVGSLLSINLRTANQNKEMFLKGPMEIVSLTGTISMNGVHLHLAASDKDGKTIGGHLVKGNKVYTTAEIVVAELEGLEFKRETDKQTTYKELFIY